MLYWPTSNPPLIKSSSGLILIVEYPPKLVIEGSWVNEYESEEYSEYKRLLLAS